MNAYIPDRWEPFIRSQLQSGRYSSEGAIIDEALRLLSEREQGSTQAANGQVAPGMTAKPAWERILEMTADVPEEEWDKLPTDLAEQHDHYIYGTPKRSPAR